jgi:hypothetical protein
MDYKSGTLITIGSFLIIKRRWGLQEEPSQAPASVYEVLVLGLVHTEVKVHGHAHIVLI